MKTKILIIGLLIGLFACSDDMDMENCTIGPDSMDRVFEFQHTTSGAVYRAWTSDPNVIETVESELAKPLESRTKHINGDIARTPSGCDVNPGWDWYFIGNSWALADISVEVCDGNPEYVEENLDYFVDNLGQFCPWSSRVLREVNE